MMYFLTDLVRRRVLRGDPVAAVDEDDAEDGDPLQVPELEQLPQHPERHRKRKLLPPAAAATTTTTNKRRRIAYFQTFAHFSVARPTFFEMSPEAMVQHSTKHGILSTPCVGYT